MNKKVIGGILTGVAIAVTVAATVYDFKTAVYQCGKCQTIHKPTIKEWTCSMHMPGKRLLKCPKCGEAGWHDKFVLADENDFI